MGKHTSEYMIIVSLYTFGQIIDFEINEIETTDNLFKRQMCS